MPKVVISQQCSGPNDSDTLITRARGKLMLIEIKRKTDKLLHYIVERVEQNSCTETWKKSVKIDKRK